jgi:hypothetical protein
MGTFGETTVLGEVSLSFTAHQRALVHTSPISGAAATLQVDEGEVVILFNFYTHLL